MSMSQSNMNIFVDAFRFHINEIGISRYLKLLTLKKNLHIYIFVNKVIDYKSRWKSFMNSNSAGGLYPNLPKKRKKNKS